MVKRKIVEALVVSVGLARIAGFATGWDGLERFGLATVAAPLPLVFTGSGGYEDFSARPTLTVRMHGQRVTVLPVDSALFARLSGPDERLAVYGTSAVWGHALPARTRDAIFSFGLCGEGPLARAAELDDEVSSWELRIETGAGPSSHSWSFGGVCAR